MYEALENWKQYKQEKDLQTKIAKEFKLFKDLTTMSSPDYLLRDNDGKLLFKGSKLGCKNYIKLQKKYEEFDEWMDELIERNGTTEY